MRSVTAALVLIGAIAVPAAAQGRGGWSQDRVPPGQMPPAGLCRVWYSGVPPGRQPPPMSCRDAERIASRSRDARVVYGAERPANRRDGYDDRYSPYGAMSVPYQNGYRDGLEKGREDARDRDSFDPVRHSRYRSADHGYQSRFGRKDEYKLVYREGFEVGYRQAYGDVRGRYGNGRWP
jgi:hypothetical protein